MQTYYFNRLPHYTPLAASYFITIRLVDSLPQQKFLELKSKFDFELNKIQSIQGLNINHRHELINTLKAKYFLNFESQLEKQFGECWLTNPKCAQIIIDQLLKYDKEYYDLYAYVVMPNHVHFLLDTALQSNYINDPDTTDLNENYKPLPQIIKLIKGGSAFQANKVLGRKGPFWAPAYFDRYIRDSNHWYNTINYIIDNPVKANLVNDSNDWPFMFIKLIEDKK